MTNFLDTLAEPDFDHGTGALPRSLDPRDWHLELIPAVAAQLTAGLPPSFLSLPIASIPYIYDQGTSPSCVAHSTCGVKSIEDFSDIGVWHRYDATELYLACGGDGSSGISTDTALAYTRDVGCLEVGTSARWKIQSYFFAPQIPGAWRETLAAALIASGPCVIATLLPARFGWDSDERATSGYHQMAVIGYDGLGDDDHVILLNSWSAGWGNKGCGRLKWSYLEGNDFQSRYVYGYKLLDVRDASPLPEPAPTPTPKPDPKPDPRPQPEPAPDTPPIVLAAVKQMVEGNYKKWRVFGKNVSGEARLFIDGTDTGAVEFDQQFVFRRKLAKGEHSATIRNPKATSLPKTFTV